MGLTFFVDLKLSLVCKHVKTNDSTCGKGVCETLTPLYFFVDEQCAIISQFDEKDATS